MSLFTIFTPAYNRANTLPDLYRSLSEQTEKDFEWLVVDDGSLDNTEELIRGYIDEEPSFPIRYYKKENGGKCSAINLGLDQARGEYFLVIDSDDKLVPSAMSLFSKWVAAVSDREDICAVAGNLGTSATETPNTLFETEYMDGSFLDRYDRADGERAIAFRTKIHRKYKYPVFEGERFMTEAVAWNRMAGDGYKVRFYNDIVCEYEYRDDGLTKSGIRLYINNPRGYALWLKEKAEFMHCSHKEKMKMWYTYLCDLELCDGDHYVPLKRRAEYIGAPTAFMYLASAAHKVRNLLKGTKK